MFKIIEGDFKNNTYSKEEYLDNWPMLYMDGADAKRDDNSKSSDSV